MKAALLALALGALFIAVAHQITRAPEAQRVPCLVLLPTDTETMRIVVLPHPTNDSTWCGP